MTKCIKISEKVKKYKRLTFQERCSIESGVRSRSSLRSIAKLIDRPVKTISLEVNRNGGKVGYYAPKAHEKQKKSNRSGYSKIAANMRLQEYILAKLKEKWSPEVIAGRWKKENNKPKISAESIYQWIYKQDNDLYLLLPRRKKKRGNRPQRATKGAIPDRVPINARPDAINDRSVPGHWEGDLMFQQGNKSQNILSLIDRKTRVVILKKNESKNSDIVIGAVKDAFLKNEYPVNSVTFDNGTEFTNHAKLEVDTYFCDPASPWQKGGVENLNGIVREYLDFRIDAKQVTQKMLDVIADSLNSKPRKILGFLTPNEAMAQIMNSTTQSRVKSATPAVEAF